VARVAARGGDAEGNAIVRGAVLGDRSAIPEATDDAWRATGIYHALSVSGMHLAVVALLWFGLVRRALAALPPLALRIDPARLAALAAAPVAIAYTLVTGGQTATVRALVVVLAILAAAALRRRLAVLDALGVAAVVILAERPSALHDPSLQLSFTAAATLCLVARWPARPDAIAGALEVEAPVGWPRRAGRAAWRWAGAVARASLWITATTAPITAWHFHEVAPGGVVGNLVAAPVIELAVIPLGLLGVALGAVSDAAGGALIDVAVALAGLVDDVARALAPHLPVLEVPPPRAAEVLAWAALCAAVWLAPRRAWRRRAAVAGAAAAVVLVASATWSAAVAPRVRDELRVTFLDVGQGDAAVIELPGGEVWLVDAGGLPIHAPDGMPAAAVARLQRSPGEAVARFLAARRIDRIDVAVISHPHPDHYLGLAAVAAHVEIGEVWSARPAPDDPHVAGGDAAAYMAGAMPSFEATVAALAARGTRRVHPPLGEARRAGGAVLEVLAPRFDDGAGEAPVAAADPVRSVNDDSLVIAVRFAGRRVLLLGDVEEEGEARLIERGDAAADVVKVAHHGSPTSSSEALIAATGAAWAVISCGRANRFGFPADEVVHRWEASGARVLRTDRSGAVTVTVAPDGTVAVDTYD
jgi:competence protein ComEC